MEKEKKIREAIRLYCKNDCTYREKYDIEHCRDSKCALWAYRMGA